MWTFSEHAVFLRNTAWVWEWQRVRASREIGFYVESVDGWEGTQLLHPERSGNHEFKMLWGLCGVWKDTPEPHKPGVEEKDHGLGGGNWSVKWHLWDSEQLMVALTHVLPSFWPCFTRGSWRDSVLQFWGIRGDFSRKKLVQMLREQKWMSNGTFFLIFKFIFTFCL